MRNLTLIFFLIATPYISTIAADDDYSNEHTIRASDIPSNAPQFEKYPATEKFRGSVAAPNIRSHPRSRMFQTMIRQGAKDGPNFAGHYTIVFWGCGTSCASLAIVDTNTGKVFHPQNLQTIDNINVDFDELEKPDGRLIKFKLDSKLLIVFGGINEEPTMRGISYFVWENEKLRRIRFVHKPYGWSAN
ncbi:MAG TPA: hypothetical protein VIF82_13465 [Burkholderiaceae bacterium]|jgi:hypothetical protein